MNRLGVLGALGSLLIVAVLPSCDGRDRPAATGTGSVSIIEALRVGDRRGFRRVMGPEPLAFPADHGPHRDVQLEWWYFTGNVADASGRPFGFQLTFFRTGLVPHSASRSSAWAATETYMAHCAISDPRGVGFQARERFARGALGLGEARGDPWRVAVEDWSAAATDPGMSPLRLTARDGDLGLDLVLRTKKPLVLHGDRGYSRKGLDPGNASQYVAFTRWDVEGTLESAGQLHRVRGLAWMDHEWSTSVLDDGLVGWDWFSLQLDDGRDVMIYTLRQSDGRPGPYSHAAVIDQVGTPTVLAFRDVRAEVRDWWTSPHTGVRYPAAWDLTLPGAEEILQVRPLQPDQELRLAVTYYEGAVVVTASDGTPRGRGYVELVGYGVPGGR